MKFKRKIVVMIMSISLAIGHITDANAVKFVGIRNLGSSCFVNAAIQQLYHTDLFRESIMSAKITDPLKQTTIVTLKTIFDKMDKCQHERGSIDIASEIGKLEVYKGYSDDAQGVVTLLINKCDIEYQEEKNRFSKIFEIQHADKIFCQECNTNVLEHEEVYGGMLFLNSAPTLDLMLSNYCSRESLDDYTCCRCNQNKKCFLTSSFKAQGDVLMVNLGRMPENKKVRIEFNSEYNFGSCNKYILSGIIMYTGGHYYSYIRNKENNRWYCVNDSSVSEVGSFDNIKESCYGNKGSSVGATSLYYKRVV